MSKRYVEKIGRKCYYWLMIDRRGIEKLAVLARIALSEGELAELEHDVDAILEHISQIREAVLTNAATETGLNCNVFRDDTEAHESGAFTEQLLAVVPQRQGKQVKVKKIL